MLDLGDHQADPGADALPATVGNVTFVLVHVEDRWRIASAQATPVLA